MKKLSKIGIFLLAMTVFASFASFAWSAEPTPTILDNIAFDGKTNDPLGTYDNADIIVFKKGSDKIFVGIDASLQSTFEDYFASGGSVEALRAILADSDPSLSGEVELVYYTTGTTGSFLNPKGKVTSTFMFNGDDTFTITGDSMSHFSKYRCTPTTSSEESSTPSSSEESSTPSSSEESSTPSSSEVSSTPSSSEVSSTPSSSEVSSTPSSSEESSTPSSSEESSTPSSSEESSTPSSSEESSTPSSSEVSSTPSSSEVSSTPSSSEVSSTPSSSEVSSTPSSSEVSVVISLSAPNNAGNSISTISIADEEVPLDVPSMGLGFVDFAPALAVMSMLGILGIALISKKTKA